MRTMRRSIWRVLIVATGLVMLGPSPATAQAPDASPGDQVLLSGDLLVPRGRTVGEVVVITGSATVLGVVDGDVIVLDGPATISGQVAGDVVVLDGRLLLRDSAQVAGDVLSGDPVEREDGAKVAGQIREGFRVSLEGPVGVLGSLLVSIAMAVSTLISIALLLVLAPRGVERLGVATRTAPFASAGWGVAVVVALPLVAVGLAASVLGLPLGLALLLGLGLVFLLGLASAALGIGRALVPPPRSRVAAALAGWAIIAVVGLVPVLNVIAWGLASVFGLGIAVVAAWRARGTSKHRLGGVAPPVEPGAPA
jgi:hypothetical protein